MANYEYPFEKLRVYAEARKLVGVIYRLLRKYPKEELYGLCDQMRRSAVSVPSDIAEGTSRTSNKDKVHFLEMAYGSLMELLCQLQVSLDLQYISETDYQVARQFVIAVAQPLSGLRNSYLNNKSL